MKDSVKSAMAATLMDAAPMVEVWFTTDSPFLVMPDNVPKDGQCKVHIGWQLPIPIAGLELDGPSLRGIFSYNGVKSFTSIPWESVFAIAIPGPVEGTKVAVVQFQHSHAQETAAVQHKRHQSAAGQLADGGSAVMGKPHGKAGLRSVEHAPEDMKEPDPKPKGAA